MRPPSARQGIRRPPHRAGAEVESRPRFQRRSRRHPHQGQLATRRFSCIECKTAGREFDLAGWGETRCRTATGELFSYAQQDQRDTISLPLHHGAGILREACVRKPHRRRRKSTPPAWKHSGKGAALRFLTWHLMRRHRAYRDRFSRSHAMITRSDYQMGKGSCPDLTSLRYRGL